MPKKKPPQRRKRSAPQGAESHQRKQERLEARRRAKEAALIAQQKKERRDKAIRRAAFVVFLVAIIYLLFLRETSPTEIQGNQISSFSTSNGGQQTHASPYNYTEEETGLNPPVSGKHNPNPATCGTHSEPIPDENLVHSLEHGAVAVLYNSEELDLPEIRDLEGLVADYDDDVLVAPYNGLPDPVVIASWSRKMPLDNPELDVINEYIEQFRDTEPAPEASQQDCAHDEDDQFEPPEPSPAPSPEPSPSPEDEGGNDDNGGGNDDAGGNNNDDTGGNENEDDKNDDGADDKGDDKNEDDNGGANDDETGDDNGGNN